MERDENIARASKILMAMNEENRVCDFALSSRKNWKPPKTCRAEVT